MQHTKMNETNITGHHHRSADPSLNSVACFKAERWHNLEERMESSIKDKFSENELGFISEVHKGSDFDRSINFRPKLVKLRIEETENVDAIAAKWEIKLQTLYNKIMRLSDDETFMLVDWACNSKEFKDLD